LARGHAGAMGGNAVLKLTVVKCDVDQNTHKSQVYMLLLLSGDVVEVRREPGRSPWEPLSSEVLSDSPCFNVMGRHGSLEKMLAS